MNVLIADGDTISRRNLVKLLEDLGHYALGHGSGEMALDIYSSVRFGLVIADLETPGLSGLDLCREIRKIGRGPRTWVIITGSGIDGSSEAEALAAGADAYLVKPVRREDLSLRLAAMEGGRLV